MLPSDQKRVIKQAKFSYPSFDKAFEKNPKKQWKIKK